MNRKLLLLALCQGLFLTNNVVFIAINGLVGLSLAPLGWMATLPVMGYVVGGAMSTGLVAKTQSRYGRRVSFQIGLAVALCSALLCAWAAWSRNFWLLVVATLVAGYYSANGQLYRFAAAELSAPAFREKAVSLVMAGGLLGAIVGPNLAARTRDLSAVPFLGAYLSLALVALLAMALMAFVTFPPAPPPPAGAPAGRPLATIMRQPVFIVAAASAALSYGVMNLLMAATPLAMDVCGLGFGDVAFVLQWHVLGMYAPSFFTGSLIRRVGVLPVLLAGAALMLGCIGLASSGVSLMHFWWALLLLGIGWNFLYIGGTTLLTETYRPAERAMVQGGNDFMVFAVQAVSSVSAGALVLGQGWSTLNLYALPAVAGVMALTASLMWQRRAAAG